MSRLSWYAIGMSTRGDRTRTAIYGLGVDPYRDPRWLAFRQEHARLRGWGCEACGRASRSNHLNHRRYPKGQHLAGISHDDAGFLCGGGQGCDAHTRATALTNSGRMNHDQAHRLVTTNSRLVRGRLRVAGWSRRAAGRTARRLAAAGVLSAVVCGLFAAADVQVTAQVVLAVSVVMAGAVWAGGRRLRRGWRRAVPRRHRPAAFIAFAVLTVWVFRVGAAEAVRLAGGWVDTARSLIGG